VINTFTYTIVCAVVALLMLIYLICVCGKTSDGEHKNMWLDNICGNKHSGVLHGVLENIVNEITHNTRHLSSISRNEQFFRCVYAERESRILNLVVMLAKGLIDEKRHIQLFQDNIIVTARKIFSHCSLRDRKETR